jgi:hypothetical protein
MIGDLLNPGPVTGAPNVDPLTGPVNAVIVTGPDAGGKDVDTLTVTKFGVSGKLSTIDALAPSKPNLLTASDSGSSDTDNITNVTTPTFTGTAPAGSLVEIWVDGVKAAEANATDTGEYTVSLALPLQPDADHTALAQTNGHSSITLPFTVDSLAPAAPVVTGTVPATTGSSMTPSVKGTGEAGSTMSLFTNATCVPPAAGSGPAAVWASTGYSATVAANSTTSFYATATDVAGNVSGCSTSWASYIQDSTAATLTSRIPAVNAISVNQVADLSATFGKPVKGYSNTTFTLKTATGTPVAGVVSYIDPGTVKLNPDVTLAAGTKYTATLTSGITDYAGNPITEVVWNFTTELGPTVTTLTPASNATGASQLNNLTAKFSKGVTGASVNGTTFTLKKGSVAVAAKITYAAPGTATLNPTATLAPATKYTATLTSGIKDAAGNALATKSWNFTTGPRPTILWTNPAANTRNVSRYANAYAKFSENMVNVSNTRFILRNSAGTRISATVTYNKTTHIARLDPSRTLAGNTTYTVSASSLLTDADGNRLTLKSWRFTTRR